MAAPAATARRPPFTAERCFRNRVDFVDRGAASDQHAMQRLHVFERHAWIEREVRRAPSLRRIIEKKQWSARLHWRADPESRVRQRSCLCPEQDALQGSGGKPQARPDAAAGATTIPSIRKSGESDSASPRAIATEALPIETAQNPFERGEIDRGAVYENPRACAAEFALHRGGNIDGGKRFVKNSERGLFEVGHWV